MRGFKKVSQKEFIKYKSEQEYNNVCLPKRSTKASAGYDFSIPYNVKINPKETITIYTGIKAYMQLEEVLFIVVRSSIGIKYKLKLVNQIAVIDSDYYNNLENEGHIIIALENVGDEVVELNTGMRFVQGIFLRYLISENEEEPNNKRQGGLGST